MLCTYINKLLPVDIVLVTLPSADNGGDFVSITAESLQKVTISHIEICYIVPVDIVPKTPSLIDDELSNLVGDKVFKLLQYKKFGLNIFECIVLLISVDLNNDPIVGIIWNVLVELINN